jgi:hypothetical protein
MRGSSSVFPVPSRIQSLLSLTVVLRNRKPGGRKVAAYAYWVDRPYQEAFETDNLTIDTACLTDTRVQQLADWTLKELRGRNLEKLADLFLFTAASPVTTAPMDFFSHPLWRSVSNQQLSLLDIPVQRNQESGVLFRSA